MRNYLKKILAGALSLAMVVTSMPSVVASTTVNLQPDDSSDNTLEVEYFNSTFYNWDGDKANAATAAADLKTTYETVTTTSGSTYQLATEIEAGEEYVIVSNGYALANNSGTLSAVSVTVDGNTVTVDNDSTVVWTAASNTSYTKYGSYSLVNNGTYLGRSSGNNAQAVSALTSVSAYGVWSYNDSALTQIGGNKSTSTYYVYYSSDGFYTSTSENSTSLYKKVASGTETTTQVATGTTQEGKGFYFTGYSNKVSSNSFSTWNGYAQNWHIYTGLAASNLKEATNAPFNNDTVNAAPLFATDGSNEEYTDVYENVKVPYYITDDGYYVLDSDTNAVYFDGGVDGAEDGATMLIADKPAYTNDSNTTGAGFQPFADITSSTSTITTTTRAGKSVTAYNTSANQVFSYGMVTEVPFQMTDDGKDANGEDITFEFCGDDDVWVYIDDILVLDIGGTHDAISGTINFADGTVKLDALNYEYIGDKAEHEGLGTSSQSLSTCSIHTDATLSQTNLYDALGTTLTGFAADGQHTLKIYYMERGKGKCNCLIKFNLPQKDSVSVTKNISDTYTDTNTKIDDTTYATLSNLDFSFTLYNDDEVVANKAYTITDATGTVVGSGVTSSTGTFTLKNNQTATFKGISLDDENTSYHVVENETSNYWTANWSATSSVTGATITGKSGKTSDTVTVTGSKSATDTISFVCENSYKYVSTLDLDVNPETIVLDYGLPVDVNILANDLVTNGTITNVTLDNEDHLGTVAYNEGVVTYTPNKELKAIDTITYTVTATDNTDGTTVEKSTTLTVIPATSVYYEESYPTITYSTGSATWTAQGTALGFKQETGLVGTTTDSTYGTDAGYLTNLKDSYGTSEMINTADYAAMYNYSFTGTGTTIYGRISTDSAYIRVLVKKLVNNAYEVVDTQYIDTRVIGTVASDATLYNIPVYNNSGLDFGDYQVTVTVYKQGTATEAGASGQVFYFDGYKVYNPMNDDATANAAYATDNEANNVVVNIRDKVVADEDEGWLDDEDVFTLTDVDGNIKSIETYESIGPNEELYLNGEGYNVTFDLVNWDSQSYKLYIGMKAPGASTGYIKINGNSVAVNNSTDCYYDISKYVDVDTTEDGDTYGEVTISGYAGLVALTNIKVVGTSEFELGYASDLSDSNDKSENTLYLVSPLVLENNEEVEESTVFTPESIQLSASYASKTKKASVTVLTSLDVAYITINGTKVNPSKVAGCYKFALTEKKVSKGKVYEVIAYDQNGNASETYSVAAN